MRNLGDLLALEDQLRFSLENNNMPLTKHLVEKIKTAEVESEGKTITKEELEDHVSKVMDGFKKEKEEEKAKIVEPVRNSSKPRMR